MNLYNNYVANSATLISPPLANIFPYLPIDFFLENLYSTLLHKKTCWNLYVIPLEKTIPIPPNRQKSCVRSMGSYDPIQNMALCLRMGGPGGDAKKALPKGTLLQSNKRPPILFWASKKKRLRTESEHNSRKVHMPT